MSEDKNNMSRRGLLRGEWFKLIRERGAKLIEQESTPEFSIKAPTGKDIEHVFPLMIDQFLPTGLKGIMVAAMLAAFMSTIDTHLNWGASYIVNDVYQPYVNPKASPRHYVWIARVTMIFIMGAAIIATTLIPDILSAFKFIGVFFAGIGTVMIARWFWWRVNALAELASLIATIILGTAVLIWIPNLETI